MHANSFLKMLITTEFTEKVEQIGFEWKIILLIYMRDH
jgi:hypothetical protein